MRVGRRDSLPGRPGSDIERDIVEFERRIRTARLAPASQSPDGRRQNGTLADGYLRLFGRA